jgi:hypothetical protein
MAVGYNPKIVTNGLVLCLDAANAKSYPGSGTTWTDLSGNDNHFTLYNGVTFSNNKMIFDGTDDYAGRNTTDSLKITNDKTITFFWNHYTDGGDTTFCSIMRCGLGNDLQYCTFSDKVSRRIGFHWNDNTFKTVASSSSVFDLDKINYGVVVISGTNCLFYINGKLISSTVVTVPTTNPTALSIGRTAFITSQDLAGEIPTLSIYNRALTAAEIQQNFQATRGRYGL